MLRVISIVLLSGSPLLLILVFGNAKYHSCWPIRESLEIETWQLATQNVRMKQIRKLGTNTGTKLKHLKLTYSFFQNRRVGLIESVTQHSDLHSLNFVIYGSFLRVESSRNVSAWCHNFPNDVMQIPRGGGGGGGGPPGPGGGGGGTPISKWRGWSLYLLGVKICGLVALRVFKSKMTYR